MVTELASKRAEYEACYKELLQLQEQTLLEEQPSVCLGGTHGVCTSARLGFRVSDLELYIYI